MNQCRKEAWKDRTCGEGVGWSLVWGSVPIARWRVARQACAPQDHAPPESCCIVRRCGGLLYSGSGGMGSPLCEYEWEIAWCKAVVYLAASEGVRDTLRESRIVQDWGVRWKTWKWWSCSQMPNQVELGCRGPSTPLLFQNVSVSQSGGVVASASMREASLEGK